MLTQIWLGPKKSWYMRTTSAVLYPGVLVASTGTDVPTATPTVAVRIDPRPTAANTPLRKTLMYPPPVVKFPTRKPLPPSRKKRTRVQAGGQLVAPQARFGCVKFLTSVSASPTRAARFDFSSPATVDRPLSERPSVEFSRRHRA